MTSYLRDRNRSRMDFTRYSNKYLSGPSAPPIFATFGAFSPTLKSSNITLSNANKTASTNTAAWSTVRCDTDVSGGITTGTIQVDSYTSQFFYMIGLSDSGFTNYNTFLGNATSGNSLAYDSNNGVPERFTDGLGTTTGSLPTPLVSTDIITFIWDASAGTVKLKKNSDPELTAWTGVTGVLRLSVSLYGTIQVTITT